MMKGKGPMPPAGTRYSMKKRSAVSPLQLLVGAAILAATACCMFLRNSRIGNFSWVKESAAGQAAKSGVSGKEPTWESLKEVQQSLAGREAKVREREEMLEKKEQRLADIKNEIIRNVEALKLLKKEIEEKSRQLDEQQEKRIKELSKIFEGAPPEKAGSIIAQTDLSTASEIIMRMDKKKAGRLWGFVDPKLAAEITRNIARKGSSIGPSPVQGREEKK
ncbi:MAG: hypothetical protein AB1611_06890 [bacterium]